MQKRTHESRVALWLVAAALHGTERVVVVAGVVSQVLLDAGQVGSKEAFAGEDERLDDPRDPPVAIRERMDRHHVEVRHRRPHDHVCVAVPVAQPVDDLLHERRDLLGVGGTVGDGAAVPADGDALAAPASRLGRPVEEGRVEVQVLDGPVAPVKRRVAGHDHHVIHRAGIARHRHHVAVARVDRLVTVDEGQGFCLGDRVPLDRRRAVGIGSAEAPAQGAHPANRLPRLAAEALL